MTKRNCETCRYCWRDDSVGYRECTCEEEFTEDEIVKYDEDMEDGCPHYEEENLDYTWLCALEKVIRSGKELKFTT